MPTKKKDIPYPADMLAALKMIEGASAPAPRPAAFAAAGPTLAAPAARAMPAEEAVVVRIPFVPPNGGPGVNILRTHRVDPKDPPALAALMTLEGVRALATSGGENFSGTARRASKITIADAPMEEFADLKDLIATLPPHKFMKNHQPPINANSAQSKRVKEEKRNVRVHAFLYAASRESDKDYHLIIGRDPNADSEIYMNVEISGLPPANSNAFPKLKAARDAFKKFFQDRLPGTSYDFYSEAPFPVLIEGSLFWDASHATGQKPGPKDLRPKIPTVWEIHPITRIKFK